MTSKTFLFVPRKAWPALTQFAPDRFPVLQILFDCPDIGSEEKKAVRANLEALVCEFRTWGEAFLRLQRDAELLVSGCMVNVEKQFLSPHLCALDKADLTFPERERWERRRRKHHPDRLVKPVADALKALEKPWKYRNPKYDKQSQG